jgi:hypothetical protein
VDWRDPGPDQVYFESLVRLNQHLVASVADRDGVLWFRAFCGIEDARGASGHVYYVGAQPTKTTGVCRSCRRYAMLWRITRQRITGPEDVVPPFEATERFGRGGWRLEEKGVDKVLVHTERSRHSNAGSPASTVVSFEISRSVTRTVAVETSAIAKGSIGFGIGASAKVGIEASIAKRYLTTDQSTISVSRGLSVNIPADSAVIVVVHWYEQRCRGIASPVDYPTLAAVPYSVVVGLTYDVDTVAD